jgi:hypothetical protein
VQSNAKKLRRKKRVPALAHTDLRGIGWHVSFRDKATGLPKKYRFGRMTESEAQVLYHQWVADHLGIAHR